MRRKEHITRIGKIKNANKTLIANSKEKVYFENLVVDARIGMKTYLK